MKLFNAAIQSMKKGDDTQQERYEYSKVKAELKDLCDKHLKDSSDILTFEANQGTLGTLLSVLGDSEILEEFEFEQVSDSVFRIKRKELDFW